MKKKDILFAGCVILCLLPFFLSDAVYTFYKTFNAEHGMIMSFVKFAVLSTLGECIGLRISAGVYNRPGFGILPRALVWGLLGLGMKLAMTVFAGGVPIFLQSMGMENAQAVMGEPLSWTKVFVAFCISVTMNSIFAPVFMTLHKITDTHILQTGGTLRGFWIRFQEDNTSFLVPCPHGDLPFAGRLADTVCRTPGNRVGSIAGRCRFEEIIVI